MNALLSHSQPFLVDKITTCGKKKKTENFSLSLTDILDLGFVAPSIIYFLKVAMLYTV